MLIMRGGYGTAHGSRRNPYIQFLRMYYKYRGKMTYDEYRKTYVRREKGPKMKWENANKYLRQKAVARNKAHVKRPWENMATYLKRTGQHDY